MLFRELAPEIRRHLGVRACTHSFEMESSLPEFDHEETNSFPHTVTLLAYFGEGSQKTVFIYLILILEISFFNRLGPTAASWPPEAPNQARTYVDIPLTSR